MKKLRTCLPLPLALAAVCLLGSHVAVTPAHADIFSGPTINIDFGSATAPSPLFLGIGADPNDTGVIWNAVSPSPSNTVVSPLLLDSKGNSTSAVLTIQGVTAVSTTDGTNPTTNALLQDYLVGQTQQIAFTITNLSPFAKYECYFYGAGSTSGQGSTFTLGGTDGVTNGAARGNTLIQGVNYAVVEGGADDHGVFNGTITSNTGAPGTFPIFNGLQIQQVAESVVTAPRFDDAFDVSQGTKIIGGSPTLNNAPLEPAIGGTSPTSPEINAVLFRDGDPAGTVDYLEFQMKAVQTIRSISLYAGFDHISPSGLPGDITLRGATRITLWAYNPVTQAYDIKAFEIFPANPYSLTLAPPNAAVQNNDDPSVLVVTANILPVTTDRFRLELVQAGGSTGGGVRINELDGFTTLNPALIQPVPVITTASSTAGQVGTPLSYQLAASNLPTSFAAADLPGGLSIDTATGIISGTPTAAGDFDAAVVAVNQSGQGPNTTLRFTITPMGDNIQGISILSPPSDIKVIQNQPVNLYASVLATPGTLGSVKFSVIDSNNNETLLFTDNVARPSTTWQPSVVGDYTVKVAAADTQGNTKFFTQPIHVLSSVGASAAQVNFLNGNVLNAAGSQNFVLGSSIQVVASALDGNGNPPANIQFFLDNQPIPTTIMGTPNLSAAHRTGRPAGRFPRTAQESGQGAPYAVGNLPLTKFNQLLTTAVTAANGATTISSGVPIQAVSAPSNTASVVIGNADGSALSSPGVAPSMVSVAASGGQRRVASVALFADAQRIGNPLTVAPYNFDLTGLAAGSHVLTALATDDTNVSNPSVPVIVNVLSDVTVVSIAATSPQADAGSGQPGAFTVTRTGGDLTKKLKVYYTVSGSATAGVEYQALKGVVKIKPNQPSAQIVVNPISVAGETGTTKVKLKLVPDDAYTLGTSTVGKVKIQSGQ